MILDHIQEDLEKIIAPIISEAGFVLAELKVLRHGRDVAIEVLADRPLGGITLEECALLNRKINESLETGQIIFDNYSLNVSSPGVDRPLKTFSDFRRVVGRPVRVFLSAPVAQRIEYEGVVSKVEAGEIIVDMGQNQVSIPIGSIHKGKQIVH